MEVMVVMEDTVAITADMVGAEVMAERVGTAGTATSTVIIISQAGDTVMAGGTVTATVSMVVIGRT
jgi:hypothetical protein